MTIAHGFLTLSLLVKLAESIPAAAERFDGIVMGVNYGFEKVRFISPVKVGSRIRCSSVLAAVELKDPNTLQTTRTMTVEIEGEAKPALVADWISRLDLRLSRARELSPSSRVRRGSASSRISTRCSRSIAAR